MHSSSLGARPGGFLCRHKLSSQCALHKHHNLNNLGIRQEIWENLFGKIDFVFETIRKNRFSDPQTPEKSISVFNVFGKIDLHYAGEVTHPSCNNRELTRAHELLIVLSVNSMVHISDSVAFVQNKD